MPPDDDYVVIATTATPEVTEVRIYAETIEKVKIGHPEIGQAAELPSIQFAVETTIQKPKRVERKRPKSFVFVGESTNRVGDPLRVPVRMIEGTTSGRVTTFFFASTEDDR